MVEYSIDEALNVIGEPIEVFHSGCQCQQICHPSMHNRLWTLAIPCIFRLFYTTDVCKQRTVWHFAGDCCG